MSDATRVRLLGGEELRAAAAVLGLEVGDGERDLAIVDLRDEAARAAAVSLAPDVPRLVIAGERERELVVASGVDPSRVAASCAPQVLGPLVTAAAPQRSRAATRAVLVSATRGGTGRTLLVANVARRLTPGLAVCAVDLTGTGALAWWLGADARPWSELEALRDELSADHVAILATAITTRLRVVGGPPIQPSIPIACATLRSALAVDDLVIIDAPLVTDPLFRAMAGLVDRVIVLSYDDPVSIATAEATLSDAVWLIGSQSRRHSLAGREVFRSLPRDETAVAEAMSTRRPVAGALGRAYDDLRDVLAVDAS